MHFVAGINKRCKCELYGNIRIEDLGKDPLLYLCPSGFVVGVAPPRWLGGGSRWENIHQMEPMDRRKVVVKFPVT